MEVNTYKIGDKVEVLRQIKPEVWRKGTVVSPRRNTAYVVILDGTGIKVDATEKQVRRL